MDHTCKTDLVVNNLSEVFNKMILDVRAKPIRTMFEGIRTKQISRGNKLGRSYRLAGGQSHQPTQRF